VTHHLAIMIASKEFLRILQVLLSLGRIERSVPIPKIVIQNGACHTPRGRKAKYCTWDT
jgi:hypothetical protein